jgi:lysophospholipase L1-like esterase
MSKRWLGFLSVCSLSVLACSSAEPRADERLETVGEAATSVWTGTWAASPQGSGTSFSGQTLRQVVHTSISGSQARVQLSNAFGSQAVTIRNVHIAARTSGSSINTATDRSLTFAGQASVTIPAGGLVASDAVAFAVPAQADVAVSFYLPQATGGATSHQQGTATNYVASGDVAGNASLSGAQTTGSYYFLANLDVQNTGAIGAVVTLGASITDGVASASDANHRWPNYLASRLLASGRTIGVLNQGISGNQLLVDGAGQSARNRFDRDVVAQPGVKWVIFADDPINDLGSSNANSTDLINALSQLVTRAHQNGLKFLCSTLTPFEGAGYWSSSKETGRQAINNFIRGSSSGCDGVVDQDTATHDPAHPTRYLPAYDAGDHLHPNEAGMRAIADAVDLNLFSSVASTTPVIALRAHANTKYVTAPGNGVGSLIASATSIGSAEEFDQIDLGSGNVALRAHANLKYVCAESAGSQSLIANRTAVGSWETFKLLQNGDGSISLLATVNARYVTAESAGAAALIANRTAIGPWEEFDRVLR